jgi:tetratricopeptide (TPR) repeat protein
MKSAPYLVTSEDQVVCSRSRVTSRMRLGAVLLAAALAAGCGGKSKDAKTTPGAGQTAQGSGDGKDPTSMADGGDPAGPFGGEPAVGGLSDGGGGGGPGGDAPGGGPTKPNVPPEPPPVVFPNHDPDPRQAKAQVDQQLAIARNSLAQTTPDADAALRAAREALKVDAASVDAAAYVAFAYYHKKHYDTAELVLDDLFKRPTAKQNANVYYVYGLIYDQTKRPDQAVLAYKRAIELDGGFASALVNLGAHQLRNKQYAEAQATYERLTRQLGRNDEVTWSALGSAYRGRAAEYPAGSNRTQLIQAAEAAYKRAIQLNQNYGPAYYNLGLLYLDADPYPVGGGSMDTLQRLNTAKSYIDQYKNMPGVDMKLYDERMKDVTKAVKREESRRKKAKAGG